MGGNEDEEAIHCGVAGIGLVSFLFACRQEDQSPEEVVTGFLEAFIANDIDGAMFYFKEDDVVFNAVNADEEFKGKEEVEYYIEFLMRQVIDMETRNFSIEGTQATWEVSLERTSTPQNSVSRPRLKQEKSHTLRQL